MKTLNKLIILISVSFLIIGCSSKNQITNSTEVDMKISTNIVYEKALNNAKYYCKQKNKFIAIKSTSNHSYISDNKPVKNSSIFLPVNLKKI